MAKRDAITVAAPIYLEPRVHSSVCCFCEIETLYYVARDNVATPEVLALVGAIQVAVDAIDREWDAVYSEGGSWDSTHNPWKTKSQSLRQAARKLAEHTDIAVPDDFVEHRQLEALFGLYAYPIGSQDGIDGIMEALNAGKLVLINAVTLASVRARLSSAKYYAEPLLGRPIVYPAGFPFHPDDASLAKLFMEVLRSQDPKIEELLKACCATGCAQLLPWVRRDLRTPDPISILAWYLSGGRRSDSSAEGFVESVVKRAVAGGEAGAQLVADQSARAQLDTPGADEPHVTCGSLSIPLRASLDSSRGKNALAQLAQAGFDYSGDASAAETERRFIKLVLDTERRQASADPAVAQLWRAICEIVDVDALQRRFDKPPRLLARVRERSERGRWVELACGTDIVLSDPALATLAFLDADEWFEGEFLFCGDQEVEDVTNIVLRLDVNELTEESLDAFLSKRAQWQQ